MWLVALPEQPGRLSPPVAGATAARASALAPTLLLLQFGVLGFGFFQDGNIRVGIFPQREEVLISSAGTRIVA